jgi:hypothetical protein
MRHKLLEASFTSPSGQELPGFHLQCACGCDEFEVGVVPDPSGSNGCLVICTCCECKLTPVVGQTEFKVEKERVN